MRWIRFGLLAVLATAIVGCIPTVSGWQGNDVHIVSGVWIGTEQDCATDDAGLTCRTTVAEALRLVGPTERSRVVRARLAELPTAYTTATGEARTARLGAGIMARSAVVLDLIDGSRRIVGMWCHAISVPTCILAPNALEYWVDGAAPPSYPPGAKFG